MLESINTNDHSNLLPSPKQIKTFLPITFDQQLFIEKTRKQVSAILKGEDDRLLLIIGPCSIHNVEEAKEYAKKIKILQEKVKDRFLILMRVYFAKSRTSVGWKGFLFDPDLDNSCNVEKGIMLTRELLSFISENQVPGATEFLDPLSVNYFEDLISWGCIGARTAESQTHRELASRLQMPIGFKNNTNGNIKIAVNGAYASGKPHTFFGINEDGFVIKIKTKGNKNCHVVLRGGDSGTNYDPKSIEQALKLIKENNLSEKVMIDCSHGNCQSDYNNQTSVFESTINQIIEGNTNISGLIIESYHFEGKQIFYPACKNHKLKYGISITDPCISWETTERLIMWGYKKLQKNTSTMYLTSASCDQ